MNNSPHLKGTDKWALDGYHKIQEHAEEGDKEFFEEHLDRMMIHPKMKNLLVTASNYEAGDKPLDQIVGHLKGHIEKDLKK